MRQIYLILIVILLPAAIQAQENNIEEIQDFTIVFDGGLLVGHSEEHYPAPFSSGISILKNFDNKLWIGGGTGATIIGKTFIPVYADIRYMPFKSKPIFLYNKFGWTFCANKTYNNETDGYNDYNVNYPHPLNEGVTTKGGVMNEAGVGFLLKRKTWSTSFSIGYYFQKTTDKTTIPNSRIYENSFNRLAARISFWF